ncbi:hypothetical protein ILUMI_12499 [Ignelater luminosus]|uniref:N-acetyltransferase domain-containing protein n=1 Tax=Ignelater luminosus TaxID=2038154 RepID=A0A8K0CZF8_IGNLU|nr:hypothetical protein ILUMI_12499 [Ignelater luminosus]
MLRFVVNLKSKLNVNTFIRTMAWSRPDTIAYPTTWSKFDGLREINGKKPKFWIQDITEDLIEPVRHSMMTGFIAEEPLCKYSKFNEDEVSVAEGWELYKHVLSNKLSVVCMTNDAEGKPKIAGISCLTRISKDEPHVEFSGKCLTKVMNLVEYVYSVKNPIDVFKVDEYMTDRGIYILPEYRGQGICNEILHAWAAVCKAIGFKVIIGTFTAIGSQKSADRVGFKELNSFDYAELEKINPDFSLPGIQEHTKSLRLLYQVV